MVVRPNPPCPFQATDYRGVRRRQNACVRKLQIPPACLHDLRGVVMRSIDISSVSSVLTTHLVNVKSSRVRKPDQPNDRELNFLIHISRLAVNQDAPCSRLVVNPSRATGGGFNLLKAGSASVSLSSREEPPSVKRCIGYRKPIERPLIVIVQSLAERSNSLTRLVVCMYNEGTKEASW